MTELTKTLVAAGIIMLMGLYIGISIYFFILDKAGDIHIDFYVLFFALASFFCFIASSVMMVTAKL